MLGDREGAKGAIKGPAGLCHQRLLKQERQVHLPDTGHLVQQDQSAFEQGVNLRIFGSVDGGIAPFQMLNSELQILRYTSVSEPFPRDSVQSAGLTIFHSLYDRGNCRQARSMIWGLHVSNDYTW